MIAKRGCSASPFLEAGPQYQEKKTVFCTRIMLDLSFLFGRIDIIDNIKHA